MIKRELLWFQKLVGQTILRKGPEDKDFKYFEIETPNSAEYAHSLQDNGYEFKEIVNVLPSQGPPKVCESCEG